MSEVQHNQAPAVDPASNGAAGPDPATAVSGIEPGPGAGERNGGDPLRAAGVGEPTVEATTVDATTVDAITVDPPLPEEEAIGELARLLSASVLKAAAWGLGTSLRMSSRFARVAADPELAGELYSDMTAGLRWYAREFLGVAELDEQVRELTLLAGIPMRRSRGVRTELELRTRGAALLRQAADVELADSPHPAYARILTELAPDEARILRLLVRSGPQPLVDIRAGNLIGLGSQLIATRLNMLGAQAGLRHRERVPAYLDNLARLGLTYISAEPLGGPADYQVLEAQPEVLGTLRDTPRAKTLRRNICLSAFGRGFCEVCMPLDSDPPPGANPGQATSG